MNRPLVQSLRRAFAAAADPERARAQQAYMKSAMAYHGIPTPDMRAICRQVFRDHPLDDAATWRDTVLELWRKARYREERYAALELLGFKAYRGYLTPAMVDTLEEFIITGAWWDYVDGIAANLVGRLLAAYPDQITPVLRRWSTSEDLWLRRSAILAQLKGPTDPGLLFELIEPSLDDGQSRSRLPKEFFLRKAIGWALREYSKTNPDDVTGFVAANRERLSGLSKREGLRVLVEQGVIDPDAARR